MQMMAIHALKMKQEELDKKQCSLQTKIEQQLKSLAFICSNPISSSPPNLFGVEKLVQTKIADERVRRARALNMRVCNLCLPCPKPLAASYSFLKDQLDIIDISLDCAWVGLDNTLFIRFISLVDRLRALTTKRKLFSLPIKIYLDEDLTRSQVAELKEAQALVVATRQDGKWASD